jgi:hypothetical protein
LTSEPARLITRKWSAAPFFCLNLKEGFYMRYILVSLSILGAFAVGCEKKQETPAASTTAAPRVDTPAVPAADKQTPTIPTAPALSADAARAADSQAAPTTAPTADAQSKLELAMQYIKDKKFDLADKLLAELDAQKSSLPASLQGQIASAQTALKTAKATSGAGDAADGIKLPSFGK